MIEKTGANAVTISTAARMVDVDRRIIRRHLEAGRFPRAQRAPGESGTGTGPWQIPVTDLYEAGLLPSDVSEGPKGTRALDEMGSAAAPTGDLDLEFTQLRAELSAAIRRAETAEATVVECERVIEAQRLALAERSSVNGRHGPKLTSQNGRRPLGGHAARRPSVLESVAERPDPRSRVERAAAGPAPGNAPHRNDEDARISAAMADASEVAESGETVEVSEAVDRPIFAPRFATSWASVPPWEHIPEVGERPQRRWWRRVS